MFGVISGIATFAAMAADTVTGGTSVLDLSGVDFSPIVASINGAIPAVLSAIIPIVGTRKVISFVMGAVKGA